MQEQQAATKASVARIQSVESSLRQEIKSLQANMVTNSSLSQSLADNNATLIEQMRALRGAPPHTTGVKRPAPGEEGAMEQK